jgi:uncharacterized membrane protein
MAQTLTVERTINPAGARLRLRGRSHDLALTAHIVSSVGWLGAAVLIAFLAVTAVLTGDSSLAEALRRTLDITPWLSVPIGVVAVVTGAVLSLGTTWGLVRHWWVVAKIGISLAVVVTDLVVLAPAAREAVATGHAPRALMDGAIAHCVVLTVATVLSVFKPRGRTPWGRRVLARSARG